MCPLSELPTILQSEYLIIPLIESEGTDIAVLSCCVPKTL